MSYLYYDNLESVAEFNDYTDVKVFEESEFVVPLVNSELLARPIHQTDLGTGKTKT